MGGTITRPESPPVWVPETKLEAEIVYAMHRRAQHGTSMKSFNTIILKFPKIDESFRKCKSIFEEFDEDKNGMIDLEELKHSFSRLEVMFTNEEFIEIFNACDINDDMGINFNEFIVLLYLVYLLKGDPTFIHAKPRMGTPELDVVFETLVDAFVCLDQNKDGHVSKSEIVSAINETASGERSSGRIAMRRFEEMDLDKIGMVNFKEFLFAFTRWVGIDESEEEEEED
ncbi:uncharacterized protein [Phyllobates terribilis]|uniref:uncharacterized protein n=1 Tax=Phyllobates terribilis TaxID=111132 RepID=UPI003CCB3D4C